MLVQALNQAVLAGEAWQHNAVLRRVFIRRLANAYLVAPLFDKQVSHAWQALQEVVLEQFETVCGFVDIQFVPDNPYPSFKEMRADIDNNGRLQIYRGGSHHTVWTPLQNWMFRVVHDYYGHYLGNNPFSFAGELQAYADYSRLISPLARIALFTEQLGELAYFFYYQDYPQQHKVAHLHEFDHELVGRILTGEGYAI